jgi:hypothetical protein
MPSLPLRPSNKSLISSRSSSKLLVAMVVTEIATALKKSKVLLISI